MWLKEKFTSKAQKKSFGRMRCIVFKENKQDFVQFIKLNATNLKLKHTFIC